MAMGVVMAASSNSIPDLSLKNRLDFLQKKFKWDLPVSS
jgi:hypothetical protein